MKIISRKEAMERGLKRYFTGRPCKHGHICERKARGDCIKCCIDSSKVRNRALRVADPERVRARDRAAAQRRKAKNPERFMERGRANNRAWRARHREEINRRKNERARARRAKNPEEARKREREKRRKWRATHPAPGKAADTTRAWKANNKERVLQNNRDWRTKNPDKYKEIQRKSERKGYDNGPQNPTGELAWLRKCEILLRTARRVAKKRARGVPLTSTEESAIAVMLSR